MLLAFALVPALLGMSRARVPSRPGRTATLALPMLFMHDLPFWVGGLGLAAVFSAELSAADAILFMLATSLSQDLYKRFVNPAATDRQVVPVARVASVAGGVLAVMAWRSCEDIVDALTSSIRCWASASSCRSSPACISTGPALDALAAIAGGVWWSWRCSSGRRQSIGAVDAGHVGADGRGVGFALVSLVLFATEGRREPDWFARQLWDRIARR